MPQYIRVSPQPLTEPEEAFVVDAENRRVQLSALSSKSHRRVRGLSSAVPGPTFAAVFPKEVDDATAIVKMTHSIVPSIVARRNVTLLFTGHSGSGKSCLMEQLLPAIVDALKPAVIAANEAHQELLSIGGEQAVTSVHRRRRAEGDAYKRKHGVVASAAGAAAAPIFGAKQATIAATAVSGIPSPAADQPDALSAEHSLFTEPVASPAKLVRARSANKRTLSPPRASSAMSRTSAASGSPSKYSLMMARMPRDNSIVDVTEVDLLDRPGSSQPLLPDLSTCPALTAGQQQQRRSLARSARRSLNVGSRIDLSEDDGEEDPAVAATVASSGMARPTLARTASPVGYCHVSLSHLREKNGWDAGEHTTLFFDGSGRSHLRLPWMEDVDRSLKTEEGLSVSCWLRAATDGEESRRQMALLHLRDPLDPNYCIKVLLNTNNVGLYEHGFTLVTLRDAHGKTLEFSFTDNLCDGNWHHLHVKLIPLLTTITLAIDGKTLRPKIVSAERALVFHSDREKEGLFGASQEVGDDGVAILSHFFTGFAFSLVFGDALGSPIANFPLIPNHSFPGTLPSLIKNENIGVVRPGEGVDLNFRTCKFVPTSPFFDGQGTHVRVGPVGDVGLQLAHNLTVEFALRCSITTDIMCVLGVVDQRGKHPMFAVELNRNSQGQYQRCTICMSIVDVMGHFARACVDAPDLFDDRWHQVCIRLHDMSFLKFKAKLDGRHTDVFTSASSTPPESFVDFEDGIHIGCLNNRGKNTLFFKGSLRQIKFSRTIDDTDELIAHWPLEEGPGARIATDAADHGFAGAYFHEKKCHSALWVPVTEATMAEVDDDTSLAQNIGEVVRHNNNMVTMAFVAVVVDASQSGHVREYLKDLIHGGRHELELFPITATNPRLNINDRRFFSTIPEECFRDVVPVDYQTHFRTGLHRSQEFQRAHLVFVLRLGDALFTAIDSVGFAKSPRATYSASQMQWADAISTFGNENKINLRLNHSIAKLEKCLVTVGSSPELYVRTHLIRESTGTQSDSMLACIALNALLSGKEFSELHLLHVLSPNATRDEVLNSLAVANAADRASVAAAAIMLQKLYRLRRARAIYREKLLVHKDDMVRQERIAMMRKDFPAETALRTKRHVLIVQCTAFPPSSNLLVDEFGFDDVKVVSRLFEQLGFTVDVSFGPTKEALLDSIAAHRAGDAAKSVFMIVYFIGFGLTDTYRRYESPTEAREWLADMESHARVELYKSCVSMFHQLQDDERVEFAELEEARRVAAEQAAAKKKKPKKKESSKKGTDEAVFRPIPRDPVQRWELKHLSPMTTPRSTHSSDEMLRDVTEEPIDRQDYVLLGNATADFDAKNTMTLKELRKAVVGTHPVRGNHAILIYDCATIPTPTNTSRGGFAGIVGTSMESLHLQYKKQQRHTLGFYVKRCLNGCAVECVRVGKHEPPSQVTLETAFRYILSKLGTSEGKFSAAAQEVNWFGEYVGDIFLAPKLLTRKEDRLKAKKVSGNRRFTAKVAIDVRGVVFEGMEKHLAPGLAKIARTALVDIRRVDVRDHFSLDLNLDFNRATRHPLEHAALKAALAQHLPQDRIRFDIGLGAQARVVVRPIKFDASVSAADASSPSDGKRDPKQAAAAYVANSKRRVEEISTFVVDVVRHLHAEPASTSGVKRAAKLGQNDIAETHTTVDLYVSVTEEECLRLERAARTGVAVVDFATLLSVAPLSERELSEFEQAERFTSIDEARRQAEAKAQLVAEAEARKRADEAAAALVKQKDKVIEGLADARAYGQLSEELAREAATTPHAEACAALFDVCAALGTTAAGQHISANAEALVAQLRGPPGTKPCEGAAATIGSEPRVIASLCKMITSLAGALPDGTAMLLLNSVTGPFVATLRRHSSTMVKHFTAAIATILSGTSDTAAVGEPLLAAITANWDQCNAHDECFELTRSAVEASVSPLLVFEAIEVVAADGETRRDASLSAALVKLLQDRLEVVTRSAQLLRTVDRGALWRASAAMQKAMVGTSAQDCVLKSAYVGFPPLVSYLAAAFAATTPEDATETSAAAELGLFLQRLASGSGFEPPCPVSATTMLEDEAAAVLVVDALRSLAGAKKAHAPPSDAASLNEAVKRIVARHPQSEQLLQLSA